MTDDAPNPNALEGQRLRSQVDLYLPALTFTILAAAIQSAKFPRCPFVDGVELLGWLAFLVSGIAGLSRLNHLPMAYYITGEKQYAEAYRNVLRKARLEGIGVLRSIEDLSDVSIEKRIAEAESGMQELVTRGRELDRKIILRFSLQWWSLVGGFVTLVLSRGLPPFLAIFR